MFETTISLLDAMGLIAGTGVESGTNLLILTVGFLVVFFTAKGIWNSLFCRGGKGK